jgi:uracil-DNA glycosylase family 4
MGMAQTFSSPSRCDAFAALITMDAHRLHYLRALEIDVWVPRGSVEESAPASESASVITNVAANTPIETQQAPLQTPESPITSSLDWPELEATVKACTKCALHRTRTQAVFGVGNRQAQWMVIGEAPGADEDAQGEPFVGRAGQLLNSMIKAVGLKREDVYIANILKSRPPNNRDPAPDEVSACIPYLHRQIELVNPKLLLCVGRIAAQNLLSTDTPIGKLRGQVHRLGQRPVVVTYHPAYLLRSPGEKRRAWQDLVLAMDTMANLSS